MHAFTRWGGLIVVAWGMVSFGSAAVPVIDTVSWPGYVQAGNQARPQQSFVGYAFKYQIAALYSPTNYDVQGLPAGLSIDHSAGVISGTPSAAGTFPLTFTATNADGSATANVTLTVQPAPAAPPVVDTLPNRDDHYLDSSVHDWNYLNGQFLITGSNGPTSYGASGLPSGAYLDTGGTGFIAYNIDNLVPGKYTVTVSATNAIGTGSSSFTWTVHPTPWVVAAQAAYQDGDTVTFYVDYNAPVLVTGQPYLSVRQGTRQAVYTSGSGTKRLVFTYTTAASDGSFTDTVPYDVQLNGGSLATMDGVSADTSVIFSVGQSPGSYSVAAVSSGTAAATTPTLDAVNGPTVATSSGAWSFNGTAAPGASVQVMIVTAPATGPLPGALTNRPVTCDSTGKWSQAVTGMLTPAGGYSFSAAVLDASGHASAASTDVNVTIAATTSNGGGVPVLTNVTVAGQVGSAITAVVVPATESPTSFSAPELGSYGLAIDSSGTITGTPTLATSTTLDVTATNALGVSFPAKVSLAITAAPATSDPATSGGTTSAAGSTPTSTTADPPSSSGTTATTAGDPPATTTTSGTSAAPSPAPSSTTPPPVASHPATAPTTASRLVNISARLRVSGGDSGGASIGGFVITGTSSKQVLIRAVGPGLAALGVAQPLADPHLTVFDHAGAVVATNDGWAGDAQVASVSTALGAFPLDAGGKDAALIATLPPGSYTAQVHAAGSGTALIEVYDVGATDASAPENVVNLSSRGYVGPGDDVMIGGFVVSGTQPKKVLIRGVGPGLASLGVANSLSDPTLAIYDHAHTLVAQNDNWETAAAVTGQSAPATAAEIAAAETATGAFPLGTGSSDSAVLLTLNPGAYTAVVSGANGATGSALVEIYEVP